MPVLIGLFLALSAASLSWEVASGITANLPSGLAHVLVAALAATCAMVGFLAGSAVCRRAQRSREHFTLFAALAFAVAAGMLGALHAVVVTAAYFSIYATWPSDPLDAVLMALAYPAFGALGFAICALGGSVIGAVASGVLRILTTAPR